MNTATFSIEGMHCEGCAQIIEALVSAEAGVHAAEASFRDSQARILFDPRSIDKARLVEAIERGGFRVRDRDRLPSSRRFPGPAGSSCRACRRSRPGVSDRRLDSSRSGLHDDRRVVSHEPREAPHDLARAEPPPNLRLTRLRRSRCAVRLEYSGLRGAARRKALIGLARRPHSGLTSNRRSSPSGCVCPNA